MSFSSYHTQGPLTLERLLFIEILDLISYGMRKRMVVPCLDLYEGPPHPLGPNR